LRKKGKIVKLRAEKGKIVQNPPFHRIFPRFVQKFGLCGNIDDLSHLLTMHEIVNKFLRKSLVRISPSATFAEKKCFPFLSFRAKRRRVVEDSVRKISGT